MDFKKIVYGIMAAFIVCFVFYEWTGFLYNSYIDDGAQLPNMSFYSDAQVIRTTTGGYTRDTVDTISGVGVSSSASETGWSQARGAFGILRDLVNFVPNLIGTAASYFGLPGVIGEMAGWAFNFGFAITLAYMIFLGVKELL